MCIRDREICLTSGTNTGKLFPKGLQDCWESWQNYQMQVLPCLLYTSDAADERSSVDLGGRRIIKKKKNETIWNSYRKK